MRVEVIKPITIGGKHRSRHEVVDVTSPHDIDRLRYSLKRGHVREVAPEPVAEAAKPEVGTKTTREDEMAAPKQDAKPATKKRSTRRRTKGD